MGNLISGANCTMIAIGFNTPLDPNALERPPLDLALAVDTSGSMRGDPIAYVRQGLLLMLPELEPGDRVTLVTYGDRAVVRVAGVSPASIALENAVRALEASGSTNLYDGLRVAFESLPEAVAGRERRVILLSDGVATTGLEDDERVLRMARGYSEQGIGLTTIGVGREFDVSLMRRLSESGAGNFYFLEDPSAVLEVFVEEVKTFLVPLALDVELALEAGTGYVVRRIYGTRQWTLSGGSARIEIPSLFVAGRTEIGEPGEGRRGGGGAILVELLPRRAATSLEAGRVGLLTMRWTSPVDGQTRTQTIDVTSRLRPGETPVEGEFADAQVEKAFIMLNLFVGFEMASERAADGSMGDALRVLQALRPNVNAWLNRQNEPDADIVADLALVDRFIDNLFAAGAAQPPPRAAPEPWPFD
jgi:Ca-activated chloride channel homolog